MVGSDTERDGSSEILFATVLAGPPEFPEMGSAHRYPGVKVQYDDDDGTLGTVDASAIRGLVQRGDERFTTRGTSLTAEEATPTALLRYVGQRVEVHM